jgi:hypothetical protein
LELGGSGLFSGVPAAFQTGSPVRALGGEGEMFVVGVAALQAVVKAGEQAAGHAAQRTGVAVTGSAPAVVHCPAAGRAGQ